MEKENLHHLSPLKLSPGPILCHYVCAYGLCGLIAVFKDKLHVTLPAEILINTGRMASPP